jgi:hypothetical protein
MPSARGNTVSKCTDFFGQARSPPSNKPQANQAAVCKHIGKKGIAARIARLLRGSAESYFIATKSEDIWCILDHSAPFSL